MEASWWSLTGEHELGPQQVEGLNMGSNPDQNMSRLRVARELAGHLSMHRQRMQHLAVTLC